MLFDESEINNVRKDITENKSSEKQNDADKCLLCNDQDNKILKKQ